MHRATHPWTLSRTLGLLVVLLFVPLLRADDAEKQRAKAVEFEKRGLWAEACRAWDELYRMNRDGPAAEVARDAYHRCLRRLHLAVRQADGVYKTALAKLTAPQALDL
ncbi:MAG: hypothetical protein K2W96_12830, partial [Gemmataceae bacterium]|nr:hypothetical protein [Gemmataceae bacterium]